MRPHPTVILLATTVAGFALVAVAFGASGSSPTLVLPKNKASLPAGKSFRLKVNTTVPGVLAVRISKSKRTSKNRSSKGVIGKDALQLAARATQAGAVTFTVKEYPQLPPSKYFLNRPGRYYWQAYRVDCEATKTEFPKPGKDLCAVPSGTRSFVLKK